MKRIAMVCVLLFSTPALAQEPVRAEVLAQDPPPPSTATLIGAQIFGMGAASMIAAGATFGWGPDTPQNERLGWSLVAGSIVLAGVGYLVGGLD